MLNAWFYVNRLVILNVIDQFEYGLINIWFVGFVKLNSLNAQVIFDFL